MYSNVIITLLIREGGRDHVQEREIEGSSVREGYIGIKCKRGRERDQVKERET